MKLRRWVAVLFLSLCFFSTVGHVTAEEGMYIGLNLPDSLVEQEEDAILGKEGFAEKTDDFRNVVVIALVVGLFASGYMLYKKSA